MFARQSDGSATALPSEARKSGVPVRSPIKLVCAVTGDALNAEDDNTRLEEIKSLNNSVDTLFILGNFTLEDFGTRVVTFELEKWICNS